MSSVITHAPRLRTLCEYDRHSLADVPGAGHDGGWPHDGIQAATPGPHTVLQELSDRIRAIPDEVAGLKPNVADSAACRRQVGWSVGLERFVENEMGRDQEWIIAMATALGTHSGLRVPIVPDMRTFRDLFEAIAAREREACAKECLAIGEKDRFTDIAERCAARIRERSNVAVEPLAEGKSDRTAG